MYTRLENINEIDQDNFIGTLCRSRECGDFIILDGCIYSKQMHYHIKFTLTGFEKWVPRALAKNGSVRDPYYPKIAGIGYLGEPGVHHSVYDQQYPRWANMIKRCYDPMHKSYKDYGGAGVTVCDRWLCFANFYYDVQEIPNYDKYLQFPSRYQLDKDYLQQDKPMNQRVYSKETCIWLEIRMNSMQRDLVTNPNKVNKYHGVYCTRNKYYPEIQHMGQRIRLGTFLDEVVAANAYNNYIRMNISQETPINDVPYMPPDEVIKYNLAAKEMCRIIQE